MFRYLLSKHKHFNTVLHRRDLQAITMEKDIHLTQFRKKSDPSPRSNVDNMLSEALPDLPTLIDGEYERMCKSKYLCFLFFFFFFNDCRFQILLLMKILQALTGNLGCHLLYRKYAI